MDIKVIEQPRVYLMASMGRPCQWSGDDNIGDDADFLAEHGGSIINRPTDEEGFDWTENVVEYAGRLCYMSFDKRRPGGNAAYIQHIKEVGHGSVLEHAVYSFIITGVSRSLTHELIRHRAGWAYSELSQRYVDLSDVAFVVPPAFQDDAVIFSKWKGACSHSLESYQSLCDAMEKISPNIPRKEIRQSARSILPNCTETKIAGTANARALRHFFELRGSIHADVEISRLAVMICKMMKEYAPNIFGDYQIICEAGREVIETKYRKV